MENMAYWRFNSMLLCIILGLGVCFEAGCIGRKYEKRESGEVKINIMGDQLRATNGRIELRFDKATGQWLSLWDTKTNEELLDSGKMVSSVLLTVGGRTTVTSGQQQIWSLIDTKSIGTDTKLESWNQEKHGDTTWLELETKQDDWRIGQDYGFITGKDFLQRRVRITWEGKGQQLLRWVELRTPSLTRLDQTRLAAPGYDFLYQQADRLPMGRWSALPEVPGIAGPGWRLGIICAEIKDLTLVVWPYNHDIPSIMLMTRGPWGAWIDQKMLAASRMNPGHTLYVGNQYFHLHQGPIINAIDHFGQFWNDVDIRLKGRTPEWGKDARIYEVQVGSSREDSKGSLKPYGSLTELTNDLTRIAKLGFNIVELMPHMPFPSYSVHDYFDINVQYGPEEELKQMITQAHKLGMKVFLDVVLHGVTDKSLNPRAIYNKSPLLKEHPGWFSRNEYGDIAETYTWAFDHSNPEVRQYMIKVFMFYTQKLDVDGFRVDAVTWNYFPNWAEDLSRPAYASIYGSAAMMDRVRTAVRQIKPDAVFYTESAGPLYHTSFDLSYNYDEQWLYGAILSGPRPQRRPARGWTEPGLTARDLGEWLEMRRICMPCGLERVHHIDSHDAYYNNGSKYRREIYGDSAARMLFALNAFIDGGVMSFKEAEKGSEDFYRKVLDLRESVPALKEGICEYLAVTPESNRVFTPLRCLGHEWALPVLNFSDKELSTHIPLDTLKLEPDSMYTLYEAFSGREITGKGRNLGSLEVKLAPYGVQLWLPI